MFLIAVLSLVRADPRQLNPLTLSNSWSSTSSVLEGACLSFFLSFFLFPRLIVSAFYVAALLMYLINIFSTLLPLGSPSKKKNKSSQGLGK
jgi:hypothetical protein